MQMKYKIFNLFVVGLFLLTACTANNDIIPPDNGASYDVIGTWRVIGGGSGNTVMPSCWEKYTDEGTFEWTFDEDWDYVLEKGGTDYGKEYWTFTNDGQFIQNEDGKEYTETYSFNNGMLVCAGAEWRIVVYENDIMVLRYEYEYKYPADKNDDTLYRFTWLQYILKKQS